MTVSNLKGFRFPLGRETVSRPAPLSVAHSLGTRAGTHSIKIPWKVVGMQENDRSLRKEGVRWQGRLAS